MSMSSTWQILYIPASLTWWCPTFHSSPAMVPVKHTVHKVFGLFLPWDPLWYLLLLQYSPDICAWSLLPTEGESLAAVQVPEVFVSFVESSSARKASLLQQYPVTGEMRSLSPFPCNSQGRKSTYYSGEEQRWFFRMEGKWREESAIWKQAVLQDWSCRDDAELTLWLQQKFVSQEHPQAQERKVSWPSWLPKKSSLGALQDLSKAPLPACPRGSSNLTLQVGEILCASEAPGCITAITRDVKELRQPLRALHHGSECEQQTRNWGRAPSHGRADLFRGEVVDFPRNTLCCTESLLHQGTRGMLTGMLTSRSSIKLLYYFACVCGIAFFCLFVCFTFELCNGLVASLASGGICASCLLTAL